MCIYACMLFFFIKEEQYNEGKSHMAAPFIVISLFFSFVIQFISQSFSEQVKHSSLVIGLRRSPAPKISPFMAKKQSEPLNMMEPLREVRDGYLISLTLGTPPQVIQAYLDTGSDLTWVPWGNVSFDCIDCDQYYRAHRLTGAFSPLYSSSSARVPCISSFCTEIHSSDNFYDPCTMAGCSLRALLMGTCSRPCPSFAYTYGEGGVAVGILTKDTLRIHGTSSNIIKEIPKFRFGCVGSTHREPIGIAGFGRGLLSLPSQLGFIEMGFSYCFLPFKFASNPNISSPLIIGDLAISSSQDSFQFTPLQRNPTYPNYYYIFLEAINVENSSTNEAPMNLREFDAKGNGGMVIDSGTTYTHLPDPLYSELLFELESVITYPRAIDQERETGFGLCYEIPCLNDTCNDDDDLLPSITFLFSSNSSLILPKEKHFYAIGVPSNSCVVKCLLYQRMDDGDSGPAAVFGSFQQQNVEVVYDFQQERIGFKPMDCASAAASYGLNKI
ncbi:hypothetical protein Nepgr_005002 [Nepenthes gracilis]|uniref:Peptidase A1 domain-containing protein n=1 Tax=Nepenthes gracilis TaxID=150966 RepID=A0AAD3XFU7_NEPGR|nr:hypothetical protein Nepgr_005002 [Nepenthes gracilis]